jgi:hypothetical protein
LATRKHFDVAKEKGDANLNGLLGELSKLNYRKNVPVNRSLENLKHGDSVFSSGQEFIDALF